MKNPMRNLVKFSFLPLVAILAAVPAAPGAFADYERAVVVDDPAATTTTTATVPDRATVTTVPDHHDTVVVKEEHEGVFGAAFHLVGKVLAFPFHLVGNIIELIL